MKRLLPVLIAVRLSGFVTAGAAPLEAVPADGSMSGFLADGTPMTGVVVETMDASRYTYVLLDTGSAKVWVASELTALQPGDRVEVSGIFPMENFHSQALDRTFDRIYFASSMGPVGFGGVGMALPAGHPEVPGYGGASDPTAYHLPAGHPEIPGHGGARDPNAFTLPKGHPEVAGYASQGTVGGTDLPPGHPEIPGLTATAGAVAVVVDRVEGGQSVAEIYAGKAELAGREVAVRGTVTKVNDGILGRNWIHLKDGTGGAGTNDLTVTSESHTARVGDTVVARGVLGLDRDFGGGYFYEVLVENAALEVE